VLRFGLRHGVYVRDRAPGHSKQPVSPGTLEPHCGILAVAAERIHFAFALARKEKFRQAVADVEETSRVS
jgi:hypothetical protein